jgi:multiple sugar transport system substrate-binding protein
MEAHMRTRLAVAAAVAAITALVAGCTTSGGGDEPAQEAEGPASLTFWNTGSDEHAAALQAAADFYKRSHPDVTIKVQALSWDDGHAKVLTAATSKTGPDIISGGMSWGIEFGELGGMIDLNAQDIGSIKQQTRPEVLKAITSPSGAIYGVSFDNAFYLLFYRPDLLQKAGLSGPPKTWEELTGAITKLKAAGIKTPLVENWNTFEWLPWFNWLKQAGGSLYADDCAKATIDSDQAVLATTTWADQFRKYGVPKAATDAAAGMANGEVAMAIDGSWVANAIDSTHPQLKGKWQVAALPTGPAGAGTFVGGRIIGVMSYTKYPKAAADFIKWTYTDEAIQFLQKEVYNKSGELWLSPRVDQINTLNTTDNVKQTLVTTMETVSGPPNCKGWELSQAEVTKKLQSVVNDNVDPKKALSEAATIMNNNLT